MNSEPPFYSVSEIAKLLNLHPLTIYRHIQNGKLRASRLGKALRISADDFFQYLNSYQSTNPHSNGEPQKITKAYFLTKSDPFYQLFRLITDD